MALREVETAQVLPGRISWGRLLKRVFESTCSKSEQRRRASEDRRRHPRAAGDPRDPGPSGIGPSAAAYGLKGPCTRAGTAHCRLSRVRRQGPIAKGCTVPVQPAWRCVPYRCGMAHSRVNPEINAKAAQGERSETCRLASHGHREARIRQFSLLQSRPGACSEPGRWRMNSDVPAARR